MANIIFQLKIGQKAYHVQALSSSRYSILGIEFPSGVGGKTTTVPCCSRSTEKHRVKIQIVENYLLLLLLFDCRFTYECTVGDEWIKLFFFFLNPAADKISLFVETWFRVGSRFHLVLLGELKGLSYYRDVCSALGYEVKSVVQLNLVFFV